MKEPFEKPGLSDLSIFKFPPLSQQEIYQSFFFLLLAAVVIVGAVYLQRYLVRSSVAKAQREAFEAATGLNRLDQPGRALLSELMAFSELGEDYRLLQDAMAFEKAVDGWLAAHPQSPGSELTSLRRFFHMSVMNPALELVNTRQLIKDLPVRLMMKLGDEKLDLYLNMLAVNERFLVLNIPDVPEVHALLRESPRVSLIFWREREGETLFPIQLQAVRHGELRVYRAAHAYLRREASRIDYRLSVNLPVDYVYMAGNQLYRMEALDEQLSGALVGKGRLTDISFGGGAMVCNQPLQANGLIRLTLKIHGHEVALIAEVLKCSPDDEGNWYANIQFRGVAGGSKDLLHRFLSREQIKRLREKNFFHFKARKKPRGPNPPPVA